MCRWETDAALKVGTDGGKMEGEEAKRQPAVLVFFPKFGVLNFNFNFNLPCIAVFKPDVREKLSILTHFPSDRSLNFEPQYHLNRWTILSNSLIFLPG